MNLILIAPPAAGKGTQAQKITKEYHIPHISIGDLLRETADENLKAQMKAGKLVSDEIVTKLLKERLMYEDCQKGFILDGYPRNLNQAKLYDGLLKELNIEMGPIIVIEISKEEALKRMVGRCVCPKCGASYNELIDGLKPTEAGICDNCGSELIKRIDDNTETFNKRFQTYEDMTKPLIAYYDNKIHFVKSENSPDETFTKIKKILGGLK